MQEGGELIKLDYGAEEEAFHMNHTKRLQPFERGNHYHGTYEIYYLLNGQRTYFIRDRSYHVLGGDLVFINRHEVHKSSVIGDPRHERIVINFREEFLASSLTLPDVDLMSPFRQKSHVMRLNLRSQMLVNSVMDKLTRELQERRTGWQSAVKLLLAELLLFAVRQAEEADGQPARVDEHPDPVHRKISEVVRYLHAHYSEPLKLETLAAEFYISPYYLSRCFKKVTGFTFIEFLTLTRIREAQLLLRRTDRKVIDIAQAAGFDNIAHFGRTFKKATGLTPGAYRRQKDS
ncbi:AraC family transcriptional regulator [Paenibacillus sambharensis]|uniref:AraC family transcriptional regulator n=1 Tax=Paenibacillus sambharensis TaxID=1803190 RepID=A0A2W1L6P1_9BACL|nr:AraC family transcriptional regulator [Paenibacillus sambharensis]PZD93780.1 AraC family transcriptional regulator [Paenibacillus sambharensis]